MIQDDEQHGIDIDSDNDRLRVIKIGQETNHNNNVEGVYGSLDWQSNGNYTYTLNVDDPDYLSLKEGETALERYTYTISDGNGGTDWANIIITVGGLNNLPVAVKDSNSVIETTVIDESYGSGTLLQNDTDADGDILVIIEMQGSTLNSVNGEYGTIDWNANGTYIYTPNAEMDSLDTGELVSDIFTYTISDGNGGTATATLEIKISGLENTIEFEISSFCKNDAPFVNYSVNPNFSTSEFPVSIKWYDSDDFLIKKSNSLPLNGFELWPGAEVDINGMATDWPGWILVNGIWIEGSDGYENSRPVAKIVVTVNPIETSFVTYPPATPECASAPTLIAIDDQDSTSEQTSVTIPVKINDSGVPINTIVSVPGSTLNGGTITVNEDGTITYTPASGFTGEDTFDYTLTTEDGRTATATVSINVIADVVPIDAVDDEFTTANGNEISGSIIDNDIYNANNLVVNTSPINEPENGIVSILPDGTFVYVPNDGFYGEDKFVYKICDIVSTQCDTATVIILSVLDTDYDGIPNDEDGDDDDDGIADELEGDRAIDTDKDGIPDYLDIDSDNDGITDNEEAQQEGNYIEPSGEDLDKDGIDDAYDPDSGGIEIIPIDTDNDGEPDFIDLDSDNDGVVDMIEGSDANGDGVTDVIPTNTDSDGDGLDDAFDIIYGWNRPFNSTGSNASLQNTDRDQYRDWRDTDDDNDGVLTSDEYQNANGGILDTDSDGIPDYLDTDNECELYIPNGFSPNDDNINDLFKIEFCGIIDVKIEIYNRWGNKVYEKDKYGDESVWGTAEAWWDGRSVDDWMIGTEKLPPATYFYILYFNDGTKEPVTGSIFLNR